MAATGPAGLIRAPDVNGYPPKVRFAPDSPLEQRRFELVWGFSSQVVVLV
jgi:hypothetical protein